MFYFRDIYSDCCKEVQRQKLIQAAATHEDLPLKNENWAERWCSVRNEFKDFCEQIHNFKIRADDVFVVTFMKCGTTWMQEIVWLLTHQLDFQRALEVNLTQRSVFLELSSLSPKIASNSIEELNELPSPRVIKSHLPVNLLPKQLWQKKQKTIFVARNVKDVVVSTFYFQTGMYRWSGTFDEFIQDFMNNEIVFTPYWAQIVDFWKLRNEPNIFFVTYEEMQRDLSSVTQRLCTFLERPQLTEPELRDFEQHVSFENMKQNKTTNMTHGFSTNFDMKDSFQFMRSGTVGSYKADLSAEHERLLNDWSRACLAKHGITQEDIFGKI